MTITKTWIGETIRPSRGEGGLATLDVLSVAEPARSA
jgi:hypothetical protein